MWPEEAPRSLSDEPREVTPEITPECCRRSGGKVYPTKFIGVNQIGWRHDKCWMVVGPSREATNEEIAWFAAKL